jgi:hypothetical protein
VVITADIPGNSMARRPDGRGGGGGFTGARGRARRSIRGISLRGLQTAEYGVELQE